MSDLESCPCDACAWLAKPQRSKLRPIRDGDVGGICKESRFPGSCEWSR